MDIITIYGKQGCPYTDKAVRLVEKYQTPYRLYYPTPPQARHMMEVAGHWTYPICYEGKRLIGGSDALEDMLEEHNE